MNACITCIYCGSNGPFNEEHVLPHLLGEFRDAPAIHERVCKPCNHKIGQAEEQLARSGPEAVIRGFLGVGGRKGHAEVDQYQRGSFGAHPIDLILTHPESGLDILWTVHPGSMQGAGTLRSHGCEVRQIVVRDLTGKHHPVRIRDWMRDSEQLAEEIRSLDVGECTAVTWFAADDEVEWVRQLCAPLMGDSVVLPKPDPIIFTGLKAFDVRPTDAYYRAVAKCAFHYMLAVVDAVSGSEPGFQELRTFILHGGDYSELVAQTPGPALRLPDIPGSAPYAGSVLPNPYDQPWHYAHVVSAEWNVLGILGRVCFFWSQSALPAVYHVRLTADADLLERPGSVAHLFVYDPGGKAGKFSGDAIQIPSTYI